MGFFPSGMGSGTKPYKGGYDNTKKYNVGDTVSVLGTIYICLKTSTGNATANTTYWDVYQAAASASIAIDDSNTNTTSTTLSALAIKNLTDGKINDLNSTSATSTYSASHIETKLTNKSKVIDSSTNGNIILDGSEVVIYDDTVLKNASHTHTNKATLDKLTDNGTNILFNGSPIVSGGASEPEYVVNDAWNTSGTRTISGSNYKFYIHNTGTADLTFTINSITFTVKPTEEFEDIFDIFTQVIVAATSTFDANVSSLKSGSSLPTYSVKDYFSASANTTRSFSGSVCGIVISNDGVSALTYTVNGITMTVEAGDVVEKYFNTLTQVTVTSTVAFRAYAKSTLGTAVTGSTGVGADVTSPVVTASPNGGLFNTTQSVTLSANETSTIYYTTDGSTPTTLSSVYSTPISVSANTTLKFFAKDTAGNSGTVQSQVYTINAVDTTPPVVTSSPNGGTFGSTQSVTLSTNETATIYYTTDSSTPTISSSVYSTPLSISATTTLKFFGKDTAGNSSSVQTLIFTIDTVAPTPVDTFTVGTPTSSTIPVSWTKADLTDVANYEIAYSTDNFVSDSHISSSVVNSISTSYTVIGLAGSTLYYVRIVAIDGVGNRSTGITVQATTAVVVADTTPPNNVTAPVASNLAEHGLTLSWTASDSSDIASYDVFYGSTLLGNTTSIAYNVTGLSANTSYIFKVKSKDTTGNISTGSTITAATTASTSGDVTAPVISTDIVSGTYNATQTITITTDDAGAKIYYLTGTGTVADPTVNDTIYTVPITISTMNVTTKLNIMAIDTSGNKRFGYRTYTLDNIAPFEVSGLFAPTVKGTSVTLQWTASTSTDIKQYDIWNDTTGKWVGSTASGAVTTFNVIGLNQSTAYTFRVKSHDNAGNISAGLTTSTTTITATYIATGFVNDASLTMFEESPSNYSGVSYADNKFQGTDQWTFEMSFTAPANTYLLQRAQAGMALTTGMAAKLNRQLNNQFASSFWISGSLNKSTSSSIYTDTAATYHITLIRNASNMYMYVNGVLDYTTSMSEFIAASTQPMYIGDSSQPTTVIKNVAYYNRALSSAEITQNYNALK